MLVNELLSEPGSLPCSRFSLSPRVRHVGSYLVILFIRGYELLLCRLERWRTHA